MRANDLVLACELVGGLALLWASISVLWRSYRIDLLRHRLFAIRDRLTVMVAEGKFEYNDPSYVIFRTMVNGMIYQAERFNLFSLILLSRIPQPQSARTAYQQWSSAARKLPPETARELVQLHSQVFEAYSKHLVSGSIVLRILFLGFFLRNLVKMPVIGRRSRSLKELAKAGQFQKMEEAAYCSAEAELCAA